MKKRRAVLIGVLWLITIFAVAADSSRYASEYDDNSSQRLTSPVLDAKEAYAQGDTRFLAIKLTGGQVLLPGVEVQEAEGIRNQYGIRQLNAHPLSDPGLAPEQKIRTDALRQFYKLKRYANRYNLILLKLIKAEKLEQQRRYRY